MNRLRSPERAFSVFRRALVTGTFLGRRSRRPGRARSTRQVQRIAVAIALVHDDRRFSNHHVCQHTHPRQNARVERALCVDALSTGTVARVDEVLRRTIEHDNEMTTLSGGSLGSCVDEERSQLRELM